MRIGEVAERAGVNVETLRYYERRGLLPEPPLLPPRGDYEAFVAVPLELTPVGRRLV